ncbi:MAG: cytochrome c biogenesis protein ResB [Propionibacteriaceae bacterium]|nr:cytochrome c biogenesis protein ResB [Propionibacteriaceae bacterium]
MTVSETDTHLDPDLSQEPPSSSEDVPEVSFGDFFHRIYQVTYSKTVGLVIILALAVLVLVGVLINQAPAGVWTDPDNRDAFLTQMQSQYGGWTSLLKVLGCFHIFTSIGFYVVIVALAISILGCTTHRIPQLWQRFRHPRVVVNDHFFAAARYRASVTTSLNDDQTIATAADKLKAAHYRVLHGDGASLYADKFSWGGFGTVLAHLSFIVIIIAFMITGLAGTATVLDLSVGGAPVPLGHGTNITLQATNFDASFDAQNRPVDYVSHLQVFDGASMVVDQDVRVNEPASYNTWGFHQNSYGMAVDVSVTNAQSQTEFSGPVRQQYTSDDGTLVAGRFVMSDLGLSVDVWTAASGAVSTDLQPGQLAFVVYRDGETDPADMQVVDQGQTVTILDLTFAFNRETEYTSIMVRQDPGVPWMWTGAILAVLGMTVTFTCRQRRIWLRAKDGTLMLASADKEDSSFRQNFTHLQAQAETWFPERSK